MIRAEVGNEPVPGQGTNELFNSYAVLALSKGLKVSNEDVHDAWSAWATKYDPNNESLKPFELLPDKTKKQDTPFTLAIRKVAETLNT